jgi:hypothetical protein
MVMNVRFAALLQVFLSTACTSTTLRDGGALGDGGGDKFGLRLAVTRDVRSAVWPVNQYNARCDPVGTAGTCDPGCKWISQPQPQHLNAFFFKLHIGLKLSTPPPPPSSIQLSPCHFKHRIELRYVRMQ